MASSETWAKLRYFKKASSDNWGDPDAISDDLLLRLDDFRHYLGLSVNVLHGVKTSGHSSKSWHYGRKNESGGWKFQPCAVDVVMPGYKGHPLDLIFEAGRFGFTGIGYYPHWRWHGKAVGGMHLDMRPLSKEADGTLNYRENRWMGVMKDGKQVYIPLSFENLAKHIGERNGND